jgi:hypothetical protein
MGKANKEKNPTDVFRKAERQKELKRNKMQRKQVAPHPTKRGKQSPSALRVSLVFPAA